ncbi:ABC transporter permease [Negadavirga shengliensis]|uniref:ABC transporter permease n=1 Tax=Negadavirga shengliensis TaxID=1389218 RepID=A0ABV9SWP0_9BACT
MLRNLYKIALRNLRTNRSLTLINVLGMGVALAACMLIGLFIYDELAVDRDIPDGDRIVRIATNAGGTLSLWAGTPAPISAAVAQDFPEVQASARLMKFPELDQMLLRYESGEEVRQFYEYKGYYADSSFFDVVELPFVRGTASLALKAPSSIVLSSRIADKIFGETDPIGQSLILGLPFGNFDYTVTGVFEAESVNSHIDANFFLSMENEDFGNIIRQWTNWASNNIFYTYVKLLRGTDRDQFESKLKAYYDRRATSDMNALGIQKTVFIQPFQEIYLRSRLDFELGRTGNMTTLYVFGTVALFILLIACINFMNLTTARSERRAREVGIRKLLGAGRGPLVWQFLMESVLVALLGFGLAAILVVLAFPYFSGLIGRELMGHTHWEPWAAALALCVAAGLLAGTYPAFFLSGFQPVTVLKGRFKGRMSGFSLREVLVVTQFCISACLILMVLVIKGQIEFVRERDLGFRKDQQLVIPLRTEKAVSSYETLKNGLLQNQGIHSVTVASTYPGIESLEDMMYYADGKTVDDVVHVRHAFVGDDFIETLGFELIAGRSFTQELTAEAPLIILNESAVREFGYSVDDAVGKRVHYEWLDGKYTFEIIGIVRDFHFTSLHRHIEPFGFQRGNRGGHLIANFSPGNTSEVLDKARDVWESAGISEPFTYSFLDEDFTRNYEKEERTSRIIVSFALLALFIACMGLYGLAAFMTELKTKEIGIRKTLGASNWSIVRLLSSDMGKMVLLAVVISVPIGIYLSHSWLSNFAFRIHVGSWYFLATGLVALAVALLTVSLQSLKAALANPVESLRSE